jgi:hypothetical protein
VALAQEILKEAKSVFVWAMDFEEVVMGCDFQKSSYGMWDVTFGKDHLVRWLWLLK